MFLTVQIWTSKKIVCRFGGYHALLPVLLGNFLQKNTFVIFGGVEAHCIPEINYGFCTKKTLFFVNKIIQKYTDKILVVHRSLYDTEYKYFKTKGKQGLKNLYNIPSEKVIELKNGYSTDIYKIKNYDRSPWSFITATGRINQQTFYLKGLDLLIDLCEKMPFIKATIVGTWQLNGTTLPKNITCLPKMTPSELSEVYNKHTFYLQLSMAEGFPNALCEAMLCGCIPIGSDVFGIPEIIGDTGFLLREKNIDELIRIIENLKNFDLKNLSEKAAERIIQKFSLEERNKRFLKILRYD
ncbi:MAG: glycosyltransferase family 4 protein [Thermaurantimonas sp.]|uniref:glycosyltransferase family 4 protein n=1 Tax=Thermaurantimonas sp. TaxID=2681568 RepID=UPI00391C8A8B